MPAHQDIWESSNGAPAQIFHLENAGISARVTNLGACLVGCDVPDANGNVVDIVLQFPSPDGYRRNGSNFGAVVGRYANRIKEGRFELDGKAYQLEINNGPNCLHSGASNYAHRVWDSELLDHGVAFHLSSPDGDGGFPGEVDVTITYTLTPNAELIIDYVATTTAATVIGLTNHAYFNLVGHDAGSVLGHDVQIFADKYLEPDANVLPTGRVLSVEGTPFDFRESKSLGAEIAQAGGYDHCFVIAGRAYHNGDSSKPDRELRQAAIAVDPVSDRRMEVWTTLPGVQLYTANHLNGSSDHAGYGKHAGFCLECQQYPAAPNYPHFPSTVLRPGETLRHQTVHRFGGASR